MEHKTANIISVVFHPLLIPLYALLILLNQEAFFVLILPAKLKWIITGIVGANTLFLPLVFIWFMHSHGIISSYQMPDRRERTFPFAITAMFYIVTWYMFVNLGLPSVFYLFIFGGAMLILVALAVNLFWKISIHMVGMGGLAGGCIALAYQQQITTMAILPVLFGVAGLVAYARLRLNTHNPAQVYTGFLLGLLVMVITGWFI